MASKRRPRLDEVIGDVRVRVYATRTEYEVLLGDGDVDDPEAQVWCYPKVGSVVGWAHQARSEYVAPEPSP